MKKIWSAATWRRFHRQRLVAASLLKNSSPWPKKHDRWDMPDLHDRKDKRKLPHLRLSFFYHAHHAYPLNHVFCLSGLHRIIQHTPSKARRAESRRRKAAPGRRTPKKSLHFFLFLLCVIPLNADWAEETLAKMTHEEKIGQLLIMPACQLRGEDHREDLRRAVQEYKIGGVILKQGTAAGQLELLEWLQNLAEVPLLAVGDAEWGLGMRLQDTTSFPKNGALKDLKDTSLLYALGREVGRQCKRAGLHVNLAPVVDVNINPKNPIIGLRSFGDDAQEVARRGVLWLRGHQESGTAACAKHFPGHGDTSVDSHVDLPVILHDMQRLERVELFPFKRAIEEGVELVMTAHLLVPSLDPKNPVTFSRAIVTNLLKNKMGFNGIIITDALNMKALANYYSVEEVALNAFLAGHDLLLYGDHIAPNIDDILRVQLPRAFEALKGIPESELDVRVLKVLRLKEKYVGPVPSPAGVTEDLQTPEALQLLQKLAPR